MQIQDLILAEHASVLDAMRLLDETGYGAVFVAPDMKLKAVVTDGDIRRYILKNGNLTGDVSTMANTEPQWLALEQRSAARALMLEKTISALPLLDKSGRIADVLFDSGLDIATQKKVDLPVVVMAGGIGSRLYPYTKILPKPLIPVGDVPIVERIIQRFYDVGCTAVTMIVNYKKSMIKSYFNDIDKPYSVDYIDEDKPLGTGGGLSLLKGKINTPFFLTNCDILIDADYADIYRYHQEQGNAITMVCAVKNFVIPYGVIDLNAEGEIAAVREKPEMNFLTNTGVYIVEPHVVDSLPEDTPIPFTDIVTEQREKGNRVGVYPVSEQSWMDMGQLEELENMRRRLENSNA